MIGSGSSPRSYLSVFWRWKFVFLLFVVAAPAAAYALSAREQKTYQSSVLLQENLVGLDATLVPPATGAGGGGNVSAEVLGGEARVIETPTIAALAARRLTPQGSPTSLLNDIKATPSSSTGFITILATAGSPKRAADIANAFAAAVIAYRGRQANQLLSARIQRLRIQLSQVSKHNTVAQAELPIQLQQLRAQKAAQTANAQILQTAVPDPTAVSPHLPRAVGLGLLAGVLLGLAAVFLLDGADNRIQHPEELEELAGVPLISVLPKAAFSSRKASPRATEAFHSLRSALMVFNSDRPVSTILIASPTRREGKTTVSTGLAVAMAQAGRDVVLVEADLRRPQVAARLAIGDEVARHGGLVGVLSGQVPLQTALIDVKIYDGERIAGQLRGSLRVLAAGGTPPNPSELIGSSQMRELIGELTEFCDLVVIDSNPILSVSDPVPLLDVVSGVVLVARLGSTRSDAIARFRKLVANTSASVLGVVATDATRRLVRYHGSGHGYPSPSSGAPRRDREQSHHPEQNGADDDTDVVEVDADPVALGQGTESAGGRARQPPDPAIAPTAVNAPDQPAPSAAGPEITQTAVPDGSAVSPAAVATGTALVRARGLDGTGVSAAPAAGGTAVPSQLLGTVGIGLLVGVVGFGRRRRARPRRVRRVARH